MENPPRRVDPGEMDLIMIGNSNARETKSISMINSSLSQLMEAAREASVNMLDKRLPAQSMMPVVGDGQVLLRSEKGAVPLSKHAVAQVCGLAHLPASVASWLQDPENQAGSEFASILRDSWARNAGTKDLLVRINRKGPDGPIVRGVLSNAYGLLDNLTVLQLVEEGLPVDMRQLPLISKGTFFDPETNRMSVQVIFPSPLLGTGTDPHSRGFGFGNGEVGDSSINGRTFLWRHVCANGLTEEIEAERFRTVHRGNPVQRVRQFLQPIMARFIANQPSDAFTAYWATKEQMLAPDRIGQILQDLAPALGLSAKMASAVSAEKLPKNLVENGSTTFSVINALTEAGRDSSPDVQEVLEAAANLLVQKPQLVRAYALA